MSTDRRNFLGWISSIGTGIFVGRTPVSAQHEQHAPTSKTAADAAKTTDAHQHETISGTPVPVETPDVPRLPFQLVDGVKEFHLTAEVVRTEFLPGRIVD